MRSHHLTRLLAATALLVAAAACAPTPAAPAPGAEGGATLPAEGGYPAGTAAPAVESGYPGEATTAPAPAENNAPGDPAGGPERIRFAPGGTSAQRSGQLAAGGMAAYILNVQAGQSLQVSTTANPGPVSVVVYGADGEVLQSPMGGLPNFNGTVPTTQDYRIDIKAGPSPTAYTMTVTVPPPGAATPEAMRVSFGPGGTTSTQTGVLGANASAKYVLALVAGNQLIVGTTGTPNPVAVSVYGADGTVLQSPMGGLPGFEGAIPTTQDYYVDVIGGPEPTNYSVTFTAPAY